MEFGIAKACDPQGLVESLHISKVVQQDVQEYAMGEDVIGRGRGCDWTWERM
jgi:hypothetical protein